MTDLPPAKRRRVAPTVADPMAPATPAAAPVPTVTTPAPQSLEAAQAPHRSAAPVVRAPSRRQEPTVQLGTRVRPESDRRLRDLAAARGVTIRQVIEDLVDEAWRQELADRPSRF